jgi:hypothetical protein
MQAIIAPRVVVNRKVKRGLVLWRMLGAFGPYKKE